jgi:hypothetical protein
MSKSGYGNILRVPMKMRMVIHLAAAIALAWVASGCCTYFLVSSTHYTTRDTFNPSSLYQTTNRENFALQGTRYKNSTEREQSDASPAFVIMPRKELVPENLRTNDMLSLEDLRILPVDYTRGLKTKTQLPPKYTEIAGFPTNNVSIILKEHHPRRYRYVFVPVTVAVDIVTSPIQLICVGILWWES